jgi:hypothetical protein
MGIAKTSMLYKTRNHINLPFNALARETMCSTKVKEGDINAKDAA